MANRVVSTQPLLRMIPVRFLPGEAREVDLTLILFEERPEAEEALRKAREIGKEAQKIGILSVEGS